MENYNNLGGRSKGSFRVGVIGVIVVVIAVVGYALLRKSDINRAKESPQPYVPQSSTVRPTPTNISAPNISSPSQVQMFTIRGSNYSFDVKEIRVKKGATVKIIFQDDDGFHDLVIDEFNARTSRIKSGETNKMEFVADKTGSFQYYCSVDGHRAIGMWGTLIVE